MLPDCIAWGIAAWKGLVKLLSVSSSALLSPFATVLTVALESNLKSVPLLVGETIWGGGVSWVLGLVGPP